MGLLKEIERDNNGVVLGYWHLAQILHRVDLGQVEVTFHPYLSEAAYKAGKRPAGPALQYTLIASDFPPGADLHALTTGMLYKAASAKAAVAATLPRDGNGARLPEVNGVPTDPALAAATDQGVG